MIEFLIEIRQYTVYLLLGLFMVAIFSFIFIFNPKHNNKKLIGMGLVFVTAFIIMGMNFIIATSLRSEITKKAEFALKNHSKILINGQEVSDVNKK